MNQPDEPGVPGTAMAALPDVVVRLRGDGSCYDVQVPGAAAQPLEAVVPAEAARRLSASVAALLATGKPTALEFEVPEPDARAFEARLVPIGTGEALAVIRDVTAARAERRKRADLEARLAAASDRLTELDGELARQQLHDMLTGLATPRLFREHLVKAMRRLPRHPYTLAVMVVNLDHFEDDVNKALGRTHGDQLLQAVAFRLEQVLRGSDTVARFAGDEFAVLLDGIVEQADAVRVAERIQADLALPIMLDDVEVYTTASIGIAIAPEPGIGDRADPDRLLAEARSAVQVAKRAGRAQYAIYEAM